MLEARLARLRGSRAVGWSTVVEVTAVASSFLLIYALGHRIGPAGYGAYAFAIGVAGVASIIALPGLASAVVVAEARGDGAFLRRALARRRRWALPVGALVGGAFFTPIVGASAPSPWAWAALSIGAAANTWNSLALNALTGRGALLNLARAQLIASLATTSVVFTLPDFSDGTWAAAVQLGAAAIVQGVELRLLSRHRAVSPESRHDLDAFASELSLVGVVGSVEMRLDVIMVGAAAGPVAAGSYAFAQKLAELLKRAWLVAYRVVVPRWSATTHADARLSARRLAIAGLVLGAVFVVVTPTIAPPVASFLFDVQLDGIAFIAVALVGASALGLPVAVMEGFFQSRAAARPITLMRLAPAGAFLLAAVPVARGYGAEGIAVLRIARNSLALLVGVGFFHFSKRERT